MNHTGVCGPARPPAAARNGEVTRVAMRAADGTGGGWPMAQAERYWSLPIQLHDPFSTVTTHQDA